MFCTGLTKVFYYFVETVILGKKWVHPGWRERHQKPLGAEAMIQNEAVNEQENAFTETHG